MSPSTPTPFKHSLGADQSSFSPNVSNASQYSDEIDLLALVKAVFATWKVWLICAVLLTAVFAVTQIFSYLQSDSSNPYTRVISFTFRGVENALYPSGAPFRIQDVVAPIVIQEVYANLQLNDESADLSDIRKRITIEPYTPFYKAIEAKYSGLLATKNLDFDKAQAIQEAKSRELEQAMSGGAVLSFDPAGSSLSEQQIAALLKSIPQVWAKQSIDNRGVLKADIQLNSVNTLDNQLFQDVDYVVLSDLFADKTKSLRGNIEKVGELEGAATVRDPVSGWSLSDLNNNLNDLETYTIDELMSPIRSLGLSRNPKLAAFYYEEKREVLKEHLATLKEESSLIKAAFESYSEPQRSGVNDSRANNQSASAANFSGFVPQIGGDVLDKLLQAAGDDSTEKYRQMLNDRWLEANLKVADTNAELRRIERLIMAVKGDAQNSLTTELRDEYMTRAEQGVDQILDRLREYYAICDRIYEQISRERVGSIGYLYKDVHQGVMRSGNPIDLKRSILMYVALMVLMTFVIVPVVMIRNAMKDRAREASIDAF